MNPLILIIAGSYQQAVQWAQERNLDRWKYVQGPWSLLGYYRATLVWIGTWWHRADQYALLAEARVRGYLTWDTTPGSSQNPWQFSPARCRSGRHTTLVCEYWESDDVKRHDFLVPGLR